MAATFPRDEVDSAQPELLSAGWQICATPAGKYAHPRELTDDGWLTAVVPSTAASSLQAAGLWNVDAVERRFDAEDWWYRLRFAASPLARQNATLHFGGLATLADVWLNHTPILHSENMFRSHDVSIAALLQDSNELAIRFASLDAALKTKRPRPRWKAPMIENQQLRWFRTTLLGRTPGWSPPAAAVGPWRAISLHTGKRCRAERLQLRTSLENGIGRVFLRCRIAADAEGQVTGGELRLTRGDSSVSSPLLRTAEPDTFECNLSVSDPVLWWPHTHGEPALYDATLLVNLDDGSGIQRAVELDLGKTGFRTLSVDTRDGAFSLSVNGVPIFCRGACWTPTDVISLDTNGAMLTRILDLVRDAGMNMLRVGGTMVYETDEFLDLCAARGILVWQDFMFANLDYPETEDFVSEISTEVREQLWRLSSRPCLAVLCGNSEVEQQAAMFGADRELWSPGLFHAVIPQLVREICPDVPYWPSSAHGGAFPHQPNTGTTSYYGVGAYLRELDDARRSQVGFATESLAFANIPEPRDMERMPGGSQLKAHDPRWKRRTPRDLGAGWDFEDVRDHYLRTLFAVDPASLRYSEHERYLQLGRIATGEAMSRCFVDWRRGHSRCRGALIWFLKDLWTGAGWGVLSDAGTPKSTYYFLRRVLQPLLVGLTDEGCNGVAIHVVNESPATFVGTLDLTAHREDGVVVARGSTHVELSSHDAQEIAAASLLTYFSDLSYAYRFGPLSASVVVATLKHADGATAGQSFYFPQGLRMTRGPDTGLKASARLLPEGDAVLSVSTHLLAYAVTIRVEGFDPEDQYFHLAPDSSRDIRLRRIDKAATCRGIVEAANSSAVARIEVLP